MCVKWWNFWCFFGNEKGIKVVAEIPSREELLSRLLGSMQSPVTNFARVLKQIAEKGTDGAAVAEEAVAAE